jgi:hypothetical protein
MAGGADSGGRIDVLQPERNPMQRAAMVACHDFALGGTCLLSRPLVRQQ